MLRAVLELVLMLVVAQSIRRVLGGVMQGLGGAGGDSGPGRSAPGQGVAMVRDPVCGTFIVPDRAEILNDGGRRSYFCSTACRDVELRRRGRAPVSPGAPGAGSPRTEPSRR